MGSHDEKHLMEWEGIPLTLHLKRHFSSGFQKLYGYELVHITVRAGERLPITETGFKNLFLSLRQLADGGGLIAFIQQWLDDSAQLHSWQEYHQSLNQLELF